MSFSSCLFSLYLPIFAVTHLQLFPSSLPLIQSHKMRITPINISITLVKLSFWKYFVVCQIYHLAWRTYFLLRHVEFLLVSHLCNVRCTYNLIRKDFFSYGSKVLELRTGTEHAKWPLRDTESLQEDYQWYQAVSLFCDTQNFPLRHLTLYHRKRSLNDDYFHFSSARKSNWGGKKDDWNTSNGFLMEKHSTCKNQNILWECVDFNVFLIGFSCKSAQFLSDVLPAWLSVV